MMPLRRPHIAALTALAATAALATGAPAASASPAPVYPFSVAQFQAVSVGLALPVGVPSGGCNTASAEGQARTGGVDILSCGANFIGPVTQISTVMGPTIISPYVGSSIVAGGNVSIGSAF
jgi:hypothetical protein